MKAIILGAGQGRRLMPLTSNLPKCCLPLHGRSILEWQLSQIRQCDIDEVVVVTGFASEAVDAVVDRVSGIRVRTLHNPMYAHTDNLGTCWEARFEMQEPFVLMNGDTLFEAAVLQRLLGMDKTYHVTLATDTKPHFDLDDMKIITDGNRLLKVSKQLDISLVSGESIGLMVFDQTGADAFTKKLEEMMDKTNALKLWYLSAIDQLASKGIVGVCPIHGMSWCEVDDAADFADAADVVMHWPG
ncbi:MAG: phosphocholine cytidylyltransferase family protein [Xanthomonadales bacterium]|nr:phosphocholine cytidylyltransferase family protein [Xanthomonadales bacterium]